jgi:hypothetical protein
MKIQNTGQNTGQEIKKPKKRYYSAIFWLALIIFIYFVGQYLFREFTYKAAKNNARGEFSNIEAEIYQMPLPDPKPIKAQEKPLDQNEVLLKQQIQISELQNKFNTLQLDLIKLKTNDSLAKIILSFVKLHDLVEAGGEVGYDSELERLVVLCRSDFALTSKIDKLKLILQNKPKNYQELSGEFANLIPQIKAKQVEIGSGQGLVGSWWGRFKATVTRFIVIKKTGENRSDSDVEFVMFKIVRALDNKRLDGALYHLNLVSQDYQEILATFKIDLQNANNFQQISDEIYKYLEVLSNTISNP